MCYILLWKYIFNFSSYVENDLGWWPKFNTLYLELIDSDWDIKRSNASIRVENRIYYLFF